jgi:hypothetical protein
MVVKSLFRRKCIFFLELKSDFRSSFTSLEKSIFEKKLATTAGLRHANLEQFTRTNKRLIATAIG